MSFNYTVELTKLALDACELRQTAIANNIANHNISHYQPRSVDFESKLSSIDLNSESSLDGIKPEISTHTEKKTPELLMADSVLNMTHYRSLIRGINQQFSIMKIALRGNNER